jgi:hypothetical protein
MICVLAAEIYISILQWPCHILPFGDAGLQSGNEYAPPKLGSVFQVDRMISKSLLETGELFSAESLFAINTFN